MKSKYVPDILEGTTQYSVFRFFSIVLLIVICFIQMYNISEVRQNRKTGYHNRAVACASLKGLLANHESREMQLDPFMLDVFHEECEGDPVKELYSNAAR